MSKTLDRAIVRIEAELDSLIDDISPEDGSLTDWSSKAPDQWDMIYRDIHRAARTLAMIRQADAESVLALAMIRQAEVAESVLEVMRDLASKMGLEVSG